MPLGYSRFKANKKQIIIKFFFNNTSIVKIEENHRKKNTIFWNMSIPNLPFLSLNLTSLTIFDLSIFFSISPPNNL